MQDEFYLRALAERYRKLARRLRDKTIRARLECLAEELENRVRDLRRPLPGMPLVRPHNQMN
jgi:hypothetical protein